MFVLLTMETKRVSRRTTTVTKWNCNSWRAGWESFLTPTHVTYVCTCVFAHLHDACCSSRLDFIGKQRAGDTAHCSLSLPRFLLCWWFSVSATFWRHWIYFQGYHYLVDLQGLLPNCTIFSARCARFCVCVLWRVTLFLTGGVSNFLTGSLLEQNPCFSGRHGCDINAVCTPGEGVRFSCECTAGFAGDGRYCHGNKPTLGHMGSAENGKEQMRE